MLVHRGGVACCDNSCHGLGFYISFFSNRDTQAKKLILFVLSWAEFNLSG